MEKKEKTVVLGFLVFIFLVIAFAFFKFFFFKNYFLRYEAPCNPEIERCFVFACDPEDENCDFEEDFEYFKLVRKKAYLLEDCDEDDPGCPNFSCGKFEKCEEFFCEEDSPEEGIFCSDSEVFFEVKEKMEVARLTASENNSEDSPEENTDGDVDINVENSEEGGFSGESQLEGGE